VTGGFLLACLLLFLDGATIGLTTNAIVVAMGKQYEPWLIAAVGGAFSGLGSMAQLWWLTWVLHAPFPWAQRWKPSEDRVQAALQRHPQASFLALFVMRATPVPDWPLKLVAAWGRYPVPLYGLAVWLGALPYYYVLARIGKWVNPPLWTIVAAVVVFGVAGWIWSRTRSAKQHPAP